MTNKTNSIATRLHCSTMPIPVEFKDKALALTARYVKTFSLSGLYKMNYDIVYNRVCSLVNKQLSTNPNFSVANFSHYINTDTLFYSSEDIQTLVHTYKEKPQETFPYIICFFSRKLCSFKRNKIAYIKGLDEEDVDEVMMVALYKVLERYTPEKGFSFSYLDMELFAAVTQLGGEMHTFTLPRNDYVNYLKFSYFAEKYALTPDNIQQFLAEINLSETAYEKEDLTFPIDAQDRRYFCKITLRKAMDYFTLYTLEHCGIVSTTTYDKDTDMVIDNTGAVTDTGFEDAEMDLFASQTFPDEADARMFYRLTEPKGAIFTNQELKDDYHYTRYALSKLKEQIKKDYF